MIFKNKKGVMGMFIVFILFAIILIFLFGFGIPIVTEFNSQIYEAGNDVLSGINTTQFPTETQDAINSAIDSTPTQINILAFFYKYSWLIILVVIVLVIYLRSRTLVETELR